MKNKFILDLYEILPTLAITQTPVLRFMSQEDQVWVINLCIVDDLCYVFFKKSFWVYKKSLFSVDYLYDSIKIHLFVF